MTSIEYAIQELDKRKVQTQNIETYINWYTENLREIEPDRPKIQEALEKAGFTDIEFKLQEGNVLNLFILGAKEVLLKIDQPFTINVTMKGKGYKCDRVWDRREEKRIGEALKKKQEKIQNHLPENYRAGNFYPYNWQVKNAGEEFRATYQIIKIK